MGNYTIVKHAGILIAMQLFSLEMQVACLGNQLELHDSKRLLGYIFVRGPSMPFEVHLLPAGKEALA